MKGLRSSLGVVVLGFSLWSCGGGSTTSVPDPTPLPRAVAVNPNEQATMMLVCGEALRVRAGLVPR